MSHMTSLDKGIRGRPFGKGNPGRPKGAKNRSTVLSASSVTFLEAHKNDLLRKAFEMAMGGDPQMMKFLLGRILPRERPLKLDLPPMRFADDAVEALAFVAECVAEGKISPSECAALTTLINSYAKAIDTADVAKRLDVLEARLEQTAGSGSPTPKNASPDILLNFVPEDPNR